MSHAQRAYINQLMDKFRTNEWEVMRDWRYCNQSPQFINRLSEEEADELIDYLEDLYGIKTSKEAAVSKHNLGKPE